MAKKSTDTDGLNAIVRINTQIQGATPILLHSSNAMNPRNPILHTLEPIKGKKGKQKTELIEKSKEKADWLLSGIWLDQGTQWLNGDEFCFSGYGRPALPAEYLLRTIQAAGTAVRLGTNIKQALSEDDSFFEFQYDGPTDADLMYNDPSGIFVDYRSVKIQKARIMRTRVRIPVGWECQCSFYIDTSIIDVKTVFNILCDAGRRVGTGDYRPKFGKFIPKSWDIVGTLEDEIGGLAA